MENRIVLAGILVAAVTILVAVRASPVLAYEGPINQVDTYCAPGSIACGEIHFHGGDGPHCYGGGDCGGGSGDGGSDDGGGDDN
jgi:hypothetical protein